MARVLYVACVLLACVYGMHVHVKKYRLAGVVGCGQLDPSRILEQYCMWEPLTPHTPHHGSMVSLCLYTH